jgi:hypothetical protein
MVRWTPSLLKSIVDTLKKGGRAVRRDGTKVGLNMPLYRYEAESRPISLSFEGHDPQETFGCRSLASRLIVLD